MTFYHVSCYVNTDTKVSGYLDFLMELERPTSGEWLNSLRKKVANYIALQYSLEFFDAKFVSILSISKL